MRPRKLPRVRPQREPVRDEPKRYDIIVTIDYKSFTDAFEEAAKKMRALSESIAEIGIGTQISKPAPMNAGASITVTFDEGRWVAVTYDGGQYFRVQYAIDRNMGKGSWIGATLLSNQRMQLYDDLMMAVVIRPEGTEWVLMFTRSPIKQPERVSYYEERARELLQTLGGERGVVLLGEETTVIKALAKKLREWDQTKELGAPPELAALVEPVRKIRLGESDARCDDVDGD